MCKEKEISQSKVDRLIDALNRLTAATEALTLSDGSGLTQKEGSNQLETECRALEGTFPQRKSYPL